MKSSSSTEFTAAEGRRFAFPVGIAFLLLGGVFLWREKETLVWVAGALGGTLLVSGLLIPAHLGPVYRGWMRLALVISKVTTPIFMAVVYYVVLTPTGLLMRMVGRKPIEHLPKDGSLWQPIDGRVATDMQRQF